jgi:hypothetical protein
MRVYCAGRMRGIKFFNFPAFFQADEFLRKLGYDVVNPAYLDVLSGFDARDLPEDTDWSVLPSDLDMREVISRDLEFLCGCDTIGMAWVECLVSGGWRFANYWSAIREGAGDAPRSPPHGPKPCNEW